MSAPEPRSPPAQRLARRAVPFVIALALLAFAGSRIDLATFRAHLAHLDVPAYFAAGTAFVVGLLCADTFATGLIYKRTLPAIRFREFFALRGASYLPSLVNHHLGQVFLTVALAKLHGEGVARVAGSTLLGYASWAGLVLAAGSAAIVAAGMPTQLLALTLGPGLVYLALLAWKPERLAKTKLLGPLFEAGLAGHAFALATRLPHFVALFVGTWLPFRFFGVDIPLVKALGTVPIVMVAVTLPLTPQGFGTRDALSRDFFAAYAPGETDDARAAAVLAATLTWGVVITVVEALVGLACMRFATKMLEAKGAEAHPRDGG